MEREKERERGRQFCHWVAELALDEKLLVLIFDAQFFFLNKTRDLSSETSTATLRIMAPSSC